MFSRLNPAILATPFLALVLSAAFPLTATAQPSLSLERVATGLNRPVFATYAPGDSNRMFFVESQTGNIRILDLETGTFNADPFLTVNGLATGGGEQGLLGLAFHPDYAQNGQFFVNFTDSGGDTVIRRYTRNSADSADPSSATTILQYDQPFNNHNGGWMDFGPDGYLYISSGDGGSGNDPGNNAQTITNNLLGKILRIDVDSDAFPGDPNRNYSNPASNPFVGQTGDDEIFAYGLRNPWRNSFDRQTGDLYIADVGQGAREEINVLLSGSDGGENYGWRVREGTIKNPAFPGAPDPANAIDPIYDYQHGTGDFEGRSITGGYVYRGPLAGLDGQYFFADFVNDRLWSIEFDGTADPLEFDGTNFSNLIDWTDILTTDIGSLNNIASFAEDEFGNLYVIELGGDVYRFSAGAIPEPGIVPILCGLAAIATLRRRR